MRRPQLTYANVTATLALFIALGGTSYAVTQLPRNSVGARQLKANAVTSSKIKDRSVRASDLAPGVVSPNRGPRGPEGPAGPVGPSETIQLKRPGIVGFPSAAGGEATLGTVTLEPGAWILDANTAVVYPPSTTASNYFECLLQTAVGEVLVRGILRIGNAAGAVLGGHVPLRVAVSFAVTTQVRFYCQHSEAMAGDPYAERATFQATRAGRLEDR